MAIIVDNCKTDGYTITINGNNGEDQLVVSYTTRQDGNSAYLMFDIACDGITRLF